MFVTLRHFDGPATEVEVDPAVLHEAAVEAGSTASALDQMLRNLMQMLEPLATNWRGAGGTQFQLVQGKIDTQLGKLNNALHWLSDQVDVSSTDYANTHEELEEAMAAHGAEDDSVERLLDGKVE